MKGTIPAENEKKSIFIFFYFKVKCNMFLTCAENVKSLKQVYFLL